MNNINESIASRIPDECVLRPHAFGRRTAYWCGKPACFTKASSASLGNFVANRTVLDGFEALRAEGRLIEVVRLIERTAEWLDSATFNLLPLRYSEYARRADICKTNWSEPEMNKNRRKGHAEHKREGNLYGNEALSRARGLIPSVTPQAPFSVTLNPAVARPSSPCFSPTHNPRWRFKPG